ncbi:MAG: response regulator transcription factor [Clostridium sp.]|uniref:response regulator transcription factor n=1 Tax=Clostridium sp. TaxID=1506 RepID=UPI003D6C9433
MDKAKILIVEDDEDLGNLICDYLSIEGFTGILARDGTLGLKLILEETFDLIVLDIMLPNMDGIQLCRKTREKSHAPIIMLSAKSGEMDKILSLGVGADDYVTKPFSPMELMARIKAHLRRQEYSEVKKIDEDCVTYGELKIYSKSYKLMIKDIEIPLTTREFQLLDFLIKNEKIVFTKEQLCNEVWGYNEFMDGNTIAVYVKRLREKLSDIGKESIKTVWGVGYKWEFKHE